MMKSTLHNADCMIQTQKHNRRKFIFHFQHDEKESAEPTSHTAYCS